MGINSSKILDINPNATSTNTTATVNGSSTRSAEAPTFPKFLALPLELQLHIWEAAICPLIVTIDLAPQRASQQLAVVSHEHLRFTSQEPSASALLGICHSSTDVAEKVLPFKMVEFSMCHLWNPRRWRPMPRHMALPVLPSKPFYKLLIDSHRDTLFVASHQVWRQQRDYYFSTDANYPGEDMLRSQI
jgi:hypothetical protein